MEILPSASLDSWSTMKSTNDPKSSHDMMYCLRSADSTSATVCENKTKEFTDIIEPGIDGSTVGLSLIMTV